MSYAIIGILVVAFIAFVVMSANAWHWSNIVFLALTFLTAIGGLLAMSQVLHLRSKQMVAAEKSKVDLARVEEQIETVVNGSGISFEYSPDSLRGRSERLNLELAGRGRVWKHGAVEANNANRVFNFGSDRIQAANGISMKDMLMFVYSDRSFEDGSIHPVAFVGTMNVVKDNPGSLELEPVFIADEKEYATPSNSWTLFEKSPLDKRDAFVRSAGIVLDESDAKLNEKMTQYRTWLTEQSLPAEMFGFDLNDTEQAAKYERIVDRIMFDGLPLVKIESWIESQSGRVVKRFDPEKEEVLVRFKFNNKSNRSYQVDSNGSIESDGEFTPLGQAVNPALHAGGEISFQKGDEILVDQLTADGYQRGDEVVSKFANLEPVTEINRIYVRQLNDFPFLLTTLKRRYNEYTKEIARLDASNSRSELAVQNSQKQENERNDEIEKLLEDQGKFENDLEIVTAYAGETQLEKTETESSIKELDSEIRKTHRQIKAVVRTLMNHATESNQGIEEVPVLMSPIDQEPMLSPSSGVAPAGDVFQ